jgi:uncharacterized paraquat-inducible protein A
MCAVGASAVTLCVSYALPTIHFQAVLKSPQRYSIWGGIESLWNAGNWILAPTVFLFSMIFPVAKLLVLGLLLAGKVPGGRRVSWLGWLHLLGKWSMVDVFIVGTFVGAVQLGLIARSASEWGIHVFTLAIVMSMLSAAFIAHVEEGRREPHPGPGLNSALGRLLAGARAASLVGVFLLPVLEVSRPLFGDLVTRNEVHLWRTTLRLSKEGEFLMALVLALFVIAVPVLRALLALRLRWLGGTPVRSLRLARGLDAWAMMDVFGFGLMIVQVKLAELTTTHLLSGFWMVLAAAVLAQLEAWHLRRSSGRRSS